ncbi:MAG: BTAD domain-containing putative transcriptional regulator [Gemmatimonadota bacterium]|jgi:DNA-binding SARP family transcriptional activator/Flp pilus assembly protein TadD
MQDSDADGGVIELHTLGGVTLTVWSEPKRRSIQLAPKPLALLAYLSVECPHGHRRRDELIGLLWPERPDHRARAGLSQTLYRLKQELGSRAVLTRGQDVVCVDNDAVWCDVAEFQSALDEGRSRDALALYEGPFLEGFHLSDNEPFDHWLSQTRNRLQERAVATARDLAQEREQAGDLDEAIRFAARALDLSPFDETAVRHLMRLFDGKGDRSLALSAYERFAAHLRAELDVDPSPETKEFAERVKLRTEGNQPASEMDERWPNRGATAGVAIPPGFGAEEKSKTSPRRAGLRRPTIGLGATAIVAAVALAVWGRGSTPLNPDQVLVGGLAHPSGASFDRVATVMVERVVGSLSLLDFVPPILATGPDLNRGGRGFNADGSQNASLLNAARKVGAGTVVLCSLDSAGDSLSLRAQVVDVATGAVVWGGGARVVSTSYVEEAIDDFSQEIAWAVGRRRDPRLDGWERLADRKPRFDAYLQFVEGVETYLGSAGFRQPEGAIEYFDRATRLDSTFFAPRIWSVIAHFYMYNLELADSLATELQSISHRLPLTDRYVLESSIASREGRTGRALEVIRRAMILSPEGEYMPLAVLAALNAGHHGEALRWMTEADTARGWAAYWGQYYMSLAFAYHALGMHELELEAARRTARDAPANILLQMPEIRALAELGRPELESRLEEILARADSPYQRGEALCMAANESLSQGHVETGDALLDRCIQWDIEHLEVSGDAARLRLGNSLVLAGRLAEARTHLELLAETRADNPWVMGPLGVLEALDGNKEEAERVILHLEELDPPVPTFRQKKVYWQAAVAAHLGQLERAIEFLRQLLEAGGGEPDPRDLLLEPLWDHPLFGQLCEVKG